MNLNQLKLTRAVSILLFGMLIFTISCKKNEKLEPSELTISQLKSWYDQQSKGQNANSNIFTAYIPDWGTAQTSSVDGYNVTEISFSNPTKVVIANGAKTDAEKDKILAKTNIKLILFNLSGSKTVTGAYMMLKSDNPQKISEVHYKDFGSFTGMLSYYNFSGKFENGYTISSGKIVKSLTKSALSQNQLLQLKESRRSLGTGSEDKLMLYNINDDCDIQTYDVYYESCASIQGMPELGTTCTWIYSYSLDVINCVPGSAGPGGGGVFDGGYTGIGGGGSGGTTPQADTEANKHTDCETFTFVKTTTANWQEAGVNNIKLKWVWTNLDGSSSTELDVPMSHVVIGFPTYYTNVFDNTTHDLTPGLAANRAALAVQLARELTYKKFAHDAFPMEASVRTFFINTLNATVAANQGTAGFNGTNSPNIIFNDEKRSYITNPLDCD